ncbi:MAG: isopeptide-forming domain-containing fimbrial protein [Anaerolineales bacterium]
MGMNPDRAPYNADPSSRMPHPIRRAHPAGLNRSHFRILILSLLTAAGFASPASAPGPALAAPRLTPGVIDPPTVTLNVPATAMIGSNVTFTATFDNNDPENETGYGPFLELIIPRTGADGAGAATDDGLGTTTISATIFGSAVPARDFYRVTFGAGGTATHPIVRNASGALITVSGTPGDELVVIRLPFGSFAPDQPPATVAMTVNMSNLADLGYGLVIRARGGYEFGYTPLDDWCCGDPASATLSGYTSGSVTPALLTLAKTYAGPADVSAETATGPNFARQYSITVDIAQGQTVTDLRITDPLPNTLEYVSLVSATPGYILEDQPLAGAARNPPDNDLILRWASITGGAGTTDAAAAFSFIVPRDDADGARVINPASGVAVSSCNNALGSGSWIPIDTRDSTQTVTVDPPGCEHTLIDRSLALQKSHTNITDGSNSPGDRIDYTLEIQVSDFFAFDQVVITDILSDGQHFDVDPAFPPTLEVNGNGYALAAAAFAPANYTVDISRIDLTDGPPPPPAENPATNGTTVLTFRVSDEIITRGQNGRMIGGCVDPAGGTPNPDCSYNDGGTTAVIHFYAIIQENFTDTYPSGDWSVDQGDEFNNNALIDGRLLDTDLFAPGPNVTDDAAETFAIGTGSLTKRIYAINGSTSFSSPARIQPGDSVTYRITYVMPTSDEENLEFADYLPLPVFFVGDPDANDYDTLPPAGTHNDGPAWGFDAVGQSGQPTVIPAAGRANFGPSDTFYTYSGIVPSVSANAANNRLGFFYGDFDDPRSQSATVDILFTVTVATEPFADQMYLTNQAHAIEGSTNAGEVGSDAIVQLILTEPVLTSTKGVVWTSNPDNVFNPVARGPAGVTFLAPGSAPRWSGTIRSGPPGGLRGNPINSNVRDVDAGDTVTFAITIENTGTSLKGAFDLQIRDLLQTQYQIPGTGLNLQVYYGNGTGPITYTGIAAPGDCTGAWPGDPCGPDGTADTADDLFGWGIELVDPVGTGVCQAHDPNLGNNVILITYDLEIRTSVAPGNIINTETLIRYAGEEGGPNHVPTPSPETDQATATISGAPVKYIVSTSEPHTGFSGVETVAVGEVIRYRIVARIPESTSINFQFRDILPVGLNYLEDGTARVAFVSNGGITSAARDSIPAIPGGCNLVGTTANATTPAALPCLLDDWNTGSSNSTTADPDAYGNGVDVYIKLGDLTNSDLDDDGEFVVIEFNALVHNLTTDQNDSGDNRDNSVRAYAGVPPVQAGNDSPALRVRVVEPFLTLDKTHSALGVTVDAGDTVTYTSTITNDGSAPTNSTAAAFDVDFTDTPPAAYLTLNLVSVGVSTSGGVTGVVNTSSGNTVHLTIGSMPVGSQVIITYQVTVRTGVTPGQAIDNDADVTWTSLPGPRGTGDQTPGLPGTGTGERDGSNGPAGNPNDYARTDIVTLDIRDPMFSKSVETTSAAHTAGNNLAIGEVATFGLLVTLPEGTTPDLRVEDALPAGLAYVPGSMQVITQTNPPATCGSLGADFNGTLPVPVLTITPPGGGSGADLTFDFGAVTVVGDNIDGNNSFLICFQAVLLNESGNQASPPPLTNTGNLFIGLDTFTDSEDLAVVEPVLQIVKTVDDTDPAPGQIVTFTVVVDHAPASGATAFDAEISDTLPAGLTLDLASVSYTASGGLTGIYNGSIGNLMFISVTAFPVGGNLTITYQATVTAPFGTTVNNTANATWSSLPGLDANERTGADGPGGALNDYAATSSAPLITDRDLVKSLIADSHPAPVSALPDVSIGEMLTYQLILTIPPSSTDTYTVTDTLDTGLAFVDCADITGGADLTSSAISLNAAGNCTPAGGLGGNPLVTNSGGTVAFDFGTITNAHATNPESITIRYRVVVLDTTANVREVTLANNALMQWTSGSIRRQTAPVRIIESDLGLEKTVDRPSAVPWMVLTYRVRIFHTADSQLAAYDAVINDILPDDLTYVPGSLSFVSGSGVAPTLLDDTGIDPLSGNLVMHAEWDTLPFGQEATIQFQAVFGVVPVGGSVVNTASAEWTSLPGDVPAPPSTYLSAFNQPYSHERRYDPLYPADIYRVTSAATVGLLYLPETGFAPGRVTGLPPQPAEKQYALLSGMRLFLPRLNQNLLVVGVPITADGWDLTWLWDQAGFLEGTAYPGSAGNSVLTAHVYLPNGEPGPFVQLAALRWGDRVILISGGQRYIYEIRTNTNVLPTDITPFRHEKSSWLTLVTCLGYDPYSGEYRYRQVARAVLISIEA